MTLRDLSAKDVIQLKTGENLGRIDDVVFDEHGGRLQSVILRGRAHCFGLLGCDDDLILRGRASAPSAPTSSWSMPGRCQRAPPLMSANRIFCVKFRKNRLYFWDTML